MQIIPTLKALAVLWSAERNLSASRLGTLVINDGAFFDRLERGAGCTVSTLERFLKFFRDPANWTERGIPTPAHVLLNAMPVHEQADTAADSVTSSGKSGEVAGSMAA